MEYMRKEIEMIEYKCKNIMCVKKWYSASKLEYLYDKKCSCGSLIEYTEERRREYEI